MSTISIFHCKQLDQVSNKAAQSRTNPQQTNTSVKLRRLLTTIMFTYNCSIYLQLFRFLTTVPFTYNCSVYLQLFRLLTTVPVTYFNISFPGFSSRSRVVVIYPAHLGRQCPGSLAQRTPCVYVECFRWQVSDWKACHIEVSLISIVTTEFSSLKHRIVNGATNAISIGVCNLNFLFNSVVFTYLHKVFNKIALRIIVKHTALCMEKL